MRLTRAKLKEYLEKAEAAGACEKELDLLRSLPLKEILKYPDLPFWCYWYSCEVVDARWYEAEKYIVRSPEWAYKYTLDVIEGSWREAEKYIKKSPKWACLYACDVIKGCWPEAEEFIKQDGYWWGIYQRKFNL